MGRAVGRVLAVVLAVAVILVATGGQSQAYIGVKGGLFMPNDDDNGLKNFDNGYGGELFFGSDVGPLSLELGLGGYTAKPEGGGDDSLNTVYGSGTAKAYLPLGPLSIYGGGGAGYYYSKFSDSDSDGNGLGFHVVGGAEVSAGVISILAELKWNQAKLDFGGSEKANVGGLMLNVGLIF